jgi:hypothetical protein
MKKTTNARRLMLGLAAAGCATGIALPRQATAEVSDADFNALKQTVEKLVGEVHAMERTNAAAAQVHAQDQEQIRQLQQKLTETQQLATNAALATVAAQVPPLPGPIDEASVNHNFMIVGDAEVQFAKVAGQHAGFVLADFAPVFLYRAEDNILFEAGFDTTLANNAPGAPGYSTDFNLSFAQLDYVMNNYTTLSAGLLLLPLGTYSERNAGWLNKFPDNPLAVDALLPATGVGAELQGGIPFGQSGSSLSYQVYGVNGPSSADIGGAPSGTAGNLDLAGNVGPINLHSDPSGGGRLGVFFPIPYRPRYDLELGISGQSGEWDDAGTHLWSAGVLDAALHLGPNFEAKGEYILTRYGTDDLGLVKQHGWYAQASYKLAGLNVNLPFIDNIELVGRYDAVHNGFNFADSLFSTSDNLFYSTRRWSAGLIYYFTNTLLFEADYEWFVLRSDPAIPANQFILQLSLGF